MGGSGSGDGRQSVSSRDPNWLQPLRSEAARQTYEAETNGLLEEISTDLGRRDDAALKTHMRVLEDAIQSEFDRAIELEFGGSVQKRTYVDGISDVDLLVVLKREDVAGISAHDALEVFAARLRERLPGTEIRVGRMAVTVAYSDGTEIQLLPAVKAGEGYKIPSSRHEGWSSVVRPQEFAQKLKEVNARNQMMVVPVVKIFKVMQHQFFPENTQLSGYHAESLAIEAFKNYEGERSRKHMLEHLVNYSKEAVLRPIGDVTGQSYHVDDHMGAPNSPERKRSAQYLQRLSQRIEAANQRASRGDWEALFDAE